MSRDEAEALVRKHYGRQVDACHRLLELSWELVGARPWRGRPVDGMVDKLIASEAARGTKTFRAALDAVLGGFGPQAGMLNRALFEGMAIAHWVRANPALAAERFAEHVRHNRSLWNKRLIARQWIDEPLDQLPDLAEQRRLDKQFGEWGDKLWCGLTMHQLVENIEHEWAEGHSRTEMRDFYAIAHASNNETLHAVVRLHSR